MRINWLPRARTDVIHVRHYIKQHHTEGAKRVVLSIYAAVRYIAEQPYLGHPGRVTNTRELVVKGTPYIVVYAVTRDSLTVLAVLHAAQEWPEDF